MLDVVRRAEQKLVADKNRNKEYLAIGGDPEFCRLSAQLAFGRESTAIREGRVCTVQSLSGARPHTSRHCSDSLCTLGMRELCMHRVKVPDLGLTFMRWQASSLGLTDVQALAACAWVPSS